MNVNFDQLRHITTD